MYSVDFSFCSPLRAQSYAEIVKLACGADISASFNRDDFEEIQARLLDEAISVLPSATKASTDARDVAITEALLRRRGLSLTVEAGEAGWGGVILFDGARSVRNDIASRMDRADEHLRTLAGRQVPRLRGDES